MKKRIFSLLIIITVACVLCAAAFAADFSLSDVLSRYSITLYDINNGLPTSDANAVVQTRDGYIWIGGYGGLIRYDGKTFHNFSGDGGMRELASIRALFEADDGTLYIGTNNDGVFCYRNGDFTQILYGGISQVSVRGFVQFGNSVYAATTRGIYKISDFKIELIGGDLIPKSTIFVDIACDGAGRVFAIDSGGNLWCVSADGSVAKNPLARKYSFNCVYTNKFGYIYLGTYDSKIVFCQAQNTNLLHEIDASALTDVYGFFEDDDGNLIVHGERGLGIIKEGVLYTDLSGVIDRAVNKMEQDYEGNFWLASSRAGVYKLKQSSFAHLSHSVSLANEVVNSVCEYNRMLYIGADSGLYITTDANGVVGENPLCSLLSGVRVRCTMADREGNVWICTYQDYGVIKYDIKNSELTLFVTDDDVKSLANLRVDGFKVSVRGGLPHIKTRLTHELSDGRIVVGTNGGGAAIISGGEITRVIDADDGLLNEVILSVCEDSEGNIFLGTDGSGFYRVPSDGILKNFSTASGLSSDIILSLEYDADVDGIWISSGAELNFFDGREIKRIKKFNAGAGSILNIIRDGDILFLLKSTSIVTASCENLLGTDKFEYEILSFNDGLTAPITANSFSCRDDADNIYICTGDGVFVIAEEVLENLERGNPPPPIKVALSGVISDENSYDKLPDDLILPEATTRVTFNFSVLTFLGNDYDVYYYLEGYDDAPLLLPDTKIQSVSYTNLDGGDYTFHLKTVNSNGDYGDEVSYSFKIEHGLFEHSSVQIAVIGLWILAVTAVLFIIYRARVHAIVQRSNIYKEITHDALRAVAKTIDAKDKYTNGHSYRVALYSREIAKKMGFDEDEQEAIYYSALMHDVGKIGVPDSVLKKPDSLTPEEYDKIKDHVNIGADILKGFDALPHVSEGALYHHERYDGTGYYEGKAGEKIPLVARIICVADCFDAMSSERVYRGPLTDEQMLFEFKRYSGLQFDPKIAKIMIEFIRTGKFKEIEGRVDDIDEVFEEENKKHSKHKRKKKYKK